MKKTLLSLSIFALTACGGGNGEDKANIFGSGGANGGSGMNSVIGVWDATENMGSEGIDEGYLIIDKNGLITFYDYMGDSYDQEGNCYWINVGQLKSVGNNNFEYTPIGETTGEKPSVLTITPKDDKLTIDFNDSEDSDDTLYLTKSNKSANNFTPECVDPDSERARNKVGRRINMYPRG
jgi:hypothetical protein